jgi:GMP synthase (glutamine-hydrolysing)
MAALRRRFAVLHLEDSVKWAEGARIWADALRADGDEWVMFEVARDGTVPDDVFSFDGIVLTGSKYNLSDPVTREKPWIQAMAALLQRIAAVAAEGKRAPRVVGGCFGCQLIGYALGGDVSRNPERRFYLRAEELVPHAEFAALPHATGIILGPRCVVDVPDATTGPPRVTRIKGAGSACCCVGGACSCSTTCPALRVLKSHGDCVSRLPPGATLLASSSSCTNEIFAVGEQFLALQSHPEFDLEESIMQKIWPAVVARGSLSDEEQAASLATFQLPRHAGLLLCVIRRFLDGETVADACKDATADMTMSVAVTPAAVGGAVTSVSSSPTTSAS